MLALTAMKNAEVALEIMGLGMLTIFIVMLIIMCLVKLLAAFSGKKKD